MKKKNLNDYSNPQKIKLKKKKVKKPLLKQNIYENAN